MSKYLPQTDDQVQSILDEIGLKSLDDLFLSVPESVRKQASELEPAKSEIEVRRHIAKLTAKNNVSADSPCFAGGGVYNHYIPSVIDPISTRGEFLTAYTSYQPEVSQGTLQAIYEYQSMLCELTGMDICNASLYDAATAVVEAIYMAIRISRKSYVIIPKNINPQYLETIETYAGSNIFTPLYWESFTEGRLDLTDAAWQNEYKKWHSDGLVAEDSFEDFTKKVASFVVQSPNYYGLVEDYSSIKGVVSNALIQHVVSEVLSLGVLPSPGELDADIVTGEAQSLGIPSNFGGPHLGILGTRSKHMRQIPGRLVGRGKDAEGREGYLITLATREQHIRREKATSNICTNQGLMVIRAAMYLSIMGPSGIEDVAAINHNRTLQLIEKVKTKSVELPYKGPVFNEFVIRFADNGARETFVNKCYGQKPAIVPGIRIDETDLLVCCTELLSEEDLEEFAGLLP